MSERDDQSIDHELAGVAMAATYEHERTVSGGETEAALVAVRSRVAAGDLGGAPPSVPLTSVAASRRSPWVRFGAVAAVMAMFALGLVAIVGGGARDDLSAPPTESAAADQGVLPAPTAEQATESEPVEGTTAATTSTTTTAPTTVDAALEVIGVDALDPPRLVEPLPYFTLPREANPDGDGTIEFAVGSDHVVVNQPGTGSITIVGPDATGISARDVPVAEEIRSVVSGPGPVIYGIGDPVLDADNPTVPRAFRFVAIPFLGENEGEVVAFEEVGVNDYLEIPPYFFGHGPDGIVARGRGGETVIGYVDEFGEPTGSGESAENGTPFPVFDFKTGTDLPSPPERNTITVRGADVGWRIDITRDPAWEATFVGRNVVAPGTERAIYFERIGADTTPDVDFGVNSMPVVALLNYDGTGEWVRLPDDWDVVASDVWGTLLARITDDSIELASLDDLVPPAGPAAPRSTSTADVGSGTTVAPPTTAATQTTVADATTTTSIVDDAGSDLVQPTAIGRTCGGEPVTCTQLAATESGRIVGFDAADDMLRVYDRTGTELQAEVPIVDSFGDDETFLVAVGPDDVAYFQTFPPTAVDDQADLVAIPLVGATAGSSVMRWTGLSANGDQTLVPRKTGLTSVGCCGPRVTRPDPDDLIYRWVDRNGEVIESVAPSFDLNLGDAGNSLTRIDTASDGSPVFTRFTLPTALQYPRDFPRVVPTDDGGALAHDVVQTTTGGVDVLVDFNTTWPANGVSGGDVYYLGAGADFGVPVLEAAGTVLVGDDDGFVRRDLDEIASRSWPGDHRLLDDGETIVADGLNEFIDSTSPTWAADADLFGYQFVQSVGPNEEVQVSFVDGASPVIAVETTGLLDDSVAATQHRIVVERGADGRFRFVSGTYGFRCAEGRGHQDFSTEPCV